MARDPLRPLTEKQLRRRAQRDIQSVIGPLAKQINARSRSGAQNLEGVYSRLASSLGGYQSQQADIYGRARSSLEGYQAQGAQQLQQGGQDISAALQKQMELSGASGTIAPDLQRLSSGQGTRGGAALGELSLRQAAAENYAAQLPGFARLAGAQGIQQLQAQRQRDISDLTTKAQSSLLESLQSGRRQEYEKAVAARGFGLDYAQLAQREQEAARSEAGRNRRASQSASIAGRRAAETARHNANMEAISRSEHNRRVKERRERERHNRALEKISKKKGLKGESKSKSGL